MILAGIEAKSKRKVKEAEIEFAASEKGADVEIELQAVKDANVEELVTDQFSRWTGDRTTKQHYEFADYDQDGNFDLLFAETRNIKSGDDPAHNKLISSIHWMRNLTDSGDPKFDSPEKIYEFPENWTTSSFSIVDLNSDGACDIVASIYQLEVIASQKEVKRQIKSQVLFLKSKNEVGDNQVGEKRSNRLR